LRVKSTVVSPGYWKNSEATEQSFKDGWYHTGDICSIDNENTVRVIDRVKAIISLPNGKYYCASKLEALFERLDFVEQICLWNEPTSEKIVAIVSTKIDLLKKIFGIEGSLDSLHNPNLIRKCLDEFIKLGKSENLAIHEIPSLLILTEEEWNLGNHMLTISFKVVRNKVVLHYQQQIKQQYLSL